MSSLEKIGAWLLDGHTGNSSMSMAAVFLGAPKELRVHHPYDSSDFARCYEFLNHCLSVAEQVRLLEKMKERDEYWQKIVLHWDELTMLYLEDKPYGAAPRLYKRMKEIGL